MSVGVLDAVRYDGRLEGDGWLVFGDQTAKRSHNTALGCIRRWLVFALYWQMEVAGHKLCAISADPAGEAGPQRSGIEQPARRGRDRVGDREG